MYKKAFKTIILAILVSTLTFCALIPARKLEIQQGNVVTQEQINQLTPGMSKEQVEYLLGTTMLEPVFDANRWTYLYRVQKGNQILEHYALILYFENDALTRFVSDRVPDNNQ